MLYYIIYVEFSYIVILLFEIYIKKLSKKVDKVRFIF